MIATLQSGLDVRKVITHHMKVADFAQGFALMKQGGCGKVALVWELTCRDGRSWRYFQTLHAPCLAPTIEPGGECRDFQVRGKA